nr:MAG TPA: hypothetical protein [Caudoviricetes sp.]
MRFLPSDSCTSLHPLMCSVCTLMCSNNFHYR